MLHIQAGSWIDFPKVLKDKRLQFCLFLGAVLLVLGCQLSGADSQNLVIKNQPQYLPITAKAIIHGSTLNLEVAQTPQEQALGLMFRKDLGKDRGMLFPFKPQRPAAFWMKNTLIPLDMIFIRGEKVVKIHADVPPCTTPSCPSYPSSSPVDYVLELEGGQANVLGLREGDQILLEFLPVPQN